MLWQVKAGPAIQGIISNHVPDNQQGELQGGLTSLISLTSIIGPLLMTNAFAFFTKDDAVFQFAGAPFAIGTILIVIAFFISLSTLRLLKKKS